MLKTEAYCKRSKKERRRKTGKIILEAPKSILVKELRLRERLTLLRRPLVKLGLICDSKARIKGAKDR